MNDKIKDFNTAHDAKLKKLSKEERAKAGLKKLAQQMKADKGKIKEPEGLASGKSAKDGKMIIDLDEGHDDER
jgi:hypothetical protein